LGGDLEPVVAGPRPLLAAAFYQVLHASRVSSPGRRPRHLGYRSLTSRSRQRHCCLAQHSSHASMHRIRTVTDNVGGSIRDACDTV
jgi:hypothetical protein